VRLRSATLLEQAHMLICVSAAYEDVHFPWTTFQDFSRGPSRVVLPLLQGYLQ
jgi:hypothetical protein